MLQFCWFVIMICWGLIRLVGYGFTACPGLSPSYRGENHSDPKLAWEVDLDKPGCTMSCRGSETDPIFFCAFFWICALTPNFCN